MTIHSEHPFADPDPARNPLRRIRGRLVAPVTVWATGRGADRAGLTVSSVLVADGDPGEVVGLVDGDSELADALEPDGLLAVSVLDHRHRAVADVFAGLAPSPGGIFRTGDWTDGAWGPVLDDVAWIGVRLPATAPDRAGWALLVRGRIEQLGLGPDGVEPLGWYRGGYRHLTD
ncbi:hypothetical protein FHX74_002941 [Friedmanniella endophytica]|uniref:Flavin reductase like domain-containing protein n=1 Tax=Microlunatus kandeliicorticis TaxID=1759536 RepID=A0A7W3P6U1_9ACTN|nr:flavin reductase family protein [Microlunatus kandeliicorticis]MBA8795313.1 hypothetical protein [Microlunatus kandeliicorticis]